MALFNVNVGAVISPNDVNQFTNILNGTTTGTTITNSGRIRAQTSGANSGTGGYVGQTAAAPPLGSFIAGDFAADGTLGFLWTCISGGTSGTWLGSMTAIAETTLGSPAVNIAFSSIPQQFAHLVLIIQVKSALTTGSFLADNLNIRFNGVTSANAYNAISMYNTNSTTISAGFNTGTVISLNSVWTSFPGNTPGNAASIFIIPYYSQATFGKQIFGITHASDGGGSSQVSLTAGAQSVSVAMAAITSVNVFLGSGSNLVTGSYAGLYGVM